MRSIRSRHLATLALVALLAVGCSSTPTPSTYYLLRGELDERTVRVTAVPRVGLGNLVVASYLLSSEGIMLETGDGRIQPAATHLWAETLDLGLRWYLRGEISRELDEPIGVGIVNPIPWQYTIDVIVSRLHATMEGTALIEARFAIVPRGAPGELRVTDFARTIPLAREGYGGVVEAEKALLAELAKLVADEVRTVLNPE